MNNNNIGRHMVQTRRNHRHWVLVMVILGALVSTGTFMALRHSAVAKTYQKQVLDCQQISGTVSHVHNDDCYYNVELVCPLEEIQPHLHTSECYKEEPVLICGLEESEGHVHTEACMDAESGELICGMEEGEGAHVHTEACWAAGRVLICGQEELPVHVHDANCFITVEMTPEEIAALNSDPTPDPAASPAEDAAPAETEAPTEDGAENAGQAPANEDGSTTEEGAPKAEESAPAEGEETPAPTDTGTSESAEAAEVIPMPAITFYGRTSTLSVRVDAPEGAFPQGAYMIVSPVVDENIINAAAAEVTGEIVMVQSVDISFYDINGNEIEPQIPIQVEIVPVEVAEQSEQTIVHVDNELAATVVEQEDSTAPEVSFQSDSFSAYVIFYTRIEKTVLASDGNNYRITVNCDPAAGIPENATLEVQEILVETPEYENYRAMTEATLAENQRVTFARFFDITILADGAEVQPLVPVEVKIELVEELQDEKTEEVKAVHFSETAGVETIETVRTEEAVSFSAEGFSVYGVVGTKIIQTDVLLSDGHLYTVTVTYDDSANIPEQSSLRVITFEEGTAEYEYARNSVLADKKARSEWVDLSSFGMAALDISILNPDGKEIEPEAPVQVEIRIKELPGVENLDEIVNTLAIQHHVEVDDGVVVETVFDGSTEASFKLETNETLAAEGITVDPYSVNEEDFAMPENAMSNDEIAVSFQTPVFSTFTVTWNSSQTISNQLRVSSLSNGKYILYARDAGNNNYYALVTGTALNAVPVTVSGNTVQYTGSEDLYWDVEVSGNTYYFSFTENGATYYLAAGTTGEHVQIGTFKTDYGNADTTGWQQWSDYIHSAGDTFLQSYNGTFRTWNVRGQNNWGNNSLIYFEKEGATVSGPHATIHYVDEAGNELTVSNGQPVNDINGLYWDNWWGYRESTSTGLNYLIYDVDGYEYAYTYRNSNTTANRITPVIRLNNGQWYYTTSTNRDGISDRDWSSLNNNDDIYVVYKPKADVPTGGTPVPKITGEKPEVPTITKDSVVNGDGTNTLSLSVTGHTSIMEAEKLADVIVIYDVSGSMNYRMDSETAANDGERRMDYAQAATKSLATALLGKNTTDHPDLIRMSLISFSNTATKNLDFTTDLTTFNNAVTNLPSPEGGTNWEYALQLANEMAVESERATFVIFVTDGNPTFRQTRGILNNSTSNNGLGVWNVGTELERDVSGYYNRYYVYGGGNNDNWGRNYAAALVQAQSIVSHNKNFYTIGISNDVTNLTKLTTEAGAGADHSKTATSEAELVAAFDEIAASIIAHLGHSDIQITDGITALTQTVQKSALVNFAEDDFTYYKGHAATTEDVTNGLAEAEGEMVWVSWDPTSEGCAEAVYNTTTGAVEWNMGEGFMLEDGYTYQVRFKVWPSQAAYDLLADLNNGIKSYDSLSDAEKAQIKEPTTAGGMYTLKTNSETSYTYREATKSGDTVIPTGEPSEPGSFPDVDPLELTTKPLKVKKQWHNNYVDSRTLVDQITMELYGVDSDGITSHDFKTITLTKDGGWYAENNFISYGLVTYDTTTNAGSKVYETGHDFTLRETDDEAHYYELTAGVYRPMFINGTPTILEKVDAAPAGMSNGVFHYSDGVHHYYRLDGKIYRDTESDILLIATNSHRSYMDLNKVVVDESGVAAVDDTEFEYNITFTVPSGIANYDSVEKYIWFSIYDTVARRTLAPSEYTYSGVITPAEENPVFSGDAYANYLVAISGQQMTLKIKQGWNVRFLNLLIGTSYSFEEVNIPTGYDFVKTEVSGTRWIANMVDGTDQGQAEALEGLPSNLSASNDNTGISGTIDFANARYSTTYTNKALTQQVNVLKTSQDGQTPLPGAVFDLYTESGYNANPKTVSKTGLTSGENGMIDLGMLSYGKYYLVETSAPAGYIPLSAPVEIEVAASGVTYNQSGNSLSNNGNGISYDETTKTYTVTVTNNAGIELPQTGGIGTTLFTALGGLMTALAGAVLTIRRKRKSA